MPTLTNRGVCVEVSWRLENWRLAAGGLTAPLTRFALLRFIWRSLLRRCEDVLPSLLSEARVPDPDRPVGGHRDSLRHPLAHRSGLRDDGPLRSDPEAAVRGETPWSRDRMLGLALVEVRARQGRALRYMLVREAIERATDRPLGETVAERITSPLGLSSVRRTPARARPDFSIRPISSLRSPHLTSIKDCPARTYQIGQNGPSGRKAGGSWRWTCRARADRAGGSCPGSRARKEPGR